MVGVLPSSDKALVRVNASWMELFALMPDGDDLVARIILHLSDFTTDCSPEPDHLDTAFLESCVERPEACPERSRRACPERSRRASPERSRRDVSHFFWKADTFGVKVRGAASIRAFLANPRGLRAIRRFNLTHMNRGRNAYQASHCYSLADAMVGRN